jgi:hypothetical protein
MARSSNQVSIVTALRRIQRYSTTMREFTTLSRSNWTPAVVVGETEWVARSRDTDLT